MTRLSGLGGGVIALSLALAGSAAAEEGVAASVKITGAPPALENALRRVSGLASGKQALATRAAIRRAAGRDAADMADALKAAGYYAASVSAELAGEGDDLSVQFTVAPGPAFRITDHRIVYLDAATADRPEDFAALDITVSERADGASLEKQHHALVAALWNNGFPAARMADRRVEARMAEGVGVAIYEIESGPRAVFGPVEATGLSDTDDGFLAKLRTWETGEAFDREKLVGFRDRIAETGLYRGIDVQPGAPDDDGVTPVLVSLEERRRRTIGVGASYSTVEGPGGRLFFEYRNMFGGAERARAELRASEVEQALAFSYLKPLPLLPGSAFAQLDFRNQTTDAFNARAIELGGGFAKRWLKDRLETRAAVAFETTKIRTDAGEERIYLLSTPLALIWNDEDDPLALASGSRASLTVTPHTGTDSFTQIELTARSRFAFGPDDRITLAGRARGGATFGSRLSSLPVNKRFFSGGGASVRGYDFQAVGPLDADGAPVGGRSVAEVAAELRVRVADRWQAAAFADAGAVSGGSLPSPADDVLVGVGGGVRYLSDFGPIRIDVATPIDRRDTDRAWQIYISLGQPF